MRLDQALDCLIWAMVVVGFVLILATLL